MRYLKLGTTGRSATDPFADMRYIEQSGDRAVIDAVGKIAEARGGTRHRCPSPG
jgi:hypothetical protein